MSKEQAFCEEATTEVFLGGGAFQCLIGEPQSLFFQCREVLWFGPPQRQTEGFGGEQKSQPF